MNNTTILCFIFLGILLITIGIMNNKQCPPEKIIYKYILFYINIMKLPKFIYYKLLNNYWELR